MVLEFTGIGRKEYDAVNEKFGIDMGTGKGDWPAGLQSHAAGSTDTGWCVFEVWDSKASQEASMQSRLGAALGAVGLPQPRVLEIDVISYHTP